MRARQRGQPGPGAAPAELGRDQGKLGRSGGRADLLAKDPRPDAEKVEELFLWAFGEKPTHQKLQAALDHIEKAKAKKTAYENILWALSTARDSASTNEWLSPNQSEAGRSRAIGPLCLCYAVWAGSFSSPP